MAFINLFLLLTLLDAHLLGDRLGSNEDQFGRPLRARRERSAADVSTKLWRSDKLIFYACMVVDRLGIKCDDELAKIEPREHSYE